MAYCGDSTPQNVDWVRFPDKASYVSLLVLYFASVAGCLLALTLGKFQFFDPTLPMNSFITIGLREVNLEKKKTE